MEPSERLTCEQLLDHPYLERRVEITTNNTSEQDRRERRERRRRETEAREKNQSRSMVSAGRLLNNLLVTAVNIEVQL